MNRVKEMREERGLSQTQLSVLTGIHTATLSRIETGKTFVYPAWRKRIARAFQVAEADVFPRGGERYAGDGSEGC